ncbi:MAG: SMP-30/gluconolactonase/LRE family protein [Gammaproteobacteria bacterium]|nr:SMP-30/gluconolactonase/LRE family protein [Gammaproteobacteria bacterium]MCY4218284.1 SMP-30/gluconolactonase/LRE family protein [Gammaproteobacteria bacterium]
MRSKINLSKLRYNYIPDHILGEILTKRWADNIVPITVFVITVVILTNLIPGFLSPQSLSDAGRQMGEFLIIVCGVSIVMIAGGIDLSVGSIYAICALIAVAVVNLLEWPIPIALMISVLVGASFGAVNGYLIGYLKLRAFLTTLITFVIGRAIYDIALDYLGTPIQLSWVDSALWDFIGDGSVGLIPVSFIFATAVLVIAHIFISRSRRGWHISAIGGSRRSAFNTGINVKKVVCSTYIISGACCGISGFLFGARLNGTGPGTGIGMEILVLTACVVGGISLGGGRGSIAKGVLGGLIVLTINNSLIRMGYHSGTNQMVLGIMLTLAVILDIRWLRNRHKVLDKVYVAPVYTSMNEPISALPKDKTAYALNSRLSETELIGAGEVEGPEDVILDNNDHLYCGSRHGDIVRFFAPDYKEWEVFVHIGGFPLGLAFDQDQTLMICVGAMGLYSVTPDREVKRLSAETNRSYLSIIDDARLRDPNDLDIGSDGKIYFTDSTTRYDAHEWAIDSVENRPTGRVLVYDPKTQKTRTLLRRLNYPNGVCMAHDGESFFFAESWECRVNRYWYRGARKGQMETVIRDMPGYPDNINRASDGCYWMAWLGMRTPTYDLILKMPGTRRRMTRQLPQDDWLFPNINTGGIVKFDETGNIVEALGDLGGKHHPMVTSMREHKGYLYVGGILNNRIGKFKLHSADQNWTSNGSYWGN